MSTSMDKLKQSADAALPQKCCMCGTEPAEAPLLVSDLTLNAICGDCILHNYRALSAWAHSHIHPPKG